MIRRPPRSTPLYSSAASDVYKRQFQNLGEFENVIREKLITSPVIHCDETGMKVEGKRHWLHVVSNDKYTCYLAHQKRGSEAMDAMRILPEFKGIAAVSY